ncbi:MAG: cell wall-binding repeat-containing protein, partial [Actinomycetota bacterium]|nr:cell wall-binding repeat-containing protein [Actinomycetota bacterium]
VGGGSTFNSSAPLQSMILDAATEGGWIHNGITLADVNARVAVRDADATTDLDDDPSLPYALGKTEVNTLDDDGDGTADNEDYGPTGSAGDFRMGVPADTGVTIFTKRVLRFGGVVTSPAADCDMAAGADDVGAPARVTGLAAEPAGETASGHVELAWDEATDSGDSGLAGYLVYRWEPTQTVNPKYTPAPMLIGQTNAGQTTFTDETAIDGTEYAYHVRAIDVATNVGPRSNTATVLPDGALPEPNEIARDWGTDRYATALAISRIAFADDSVETVVIATGAAFPDALAASGLAGVHGSPLLLVGAAVTADLIDELDRLGTTSVVLIGGEKAISADVFDALHAAYDVRRVSGADRYETAAAVAREIADLGGVSDAAYFVRGDESADALSVSPFAYRTTTPVLLIATGGVPTATGGVIDELGIAAGWIIGGPTAVNQT